MYARLLKLVKPYWPHIGGGMLSSILNVAANSVALWFAASFVSTLFNATPEEMKQVVLSSDWSNINEYLKWLTYKYFTGGDKVSALKTVVVVILVSYFIKSVTYYITWLLNGWVQVRVIRNLRNMIFDHFLRQPLAFYNTRRTGDMISLAMNDVMMVNNALTTTFRPLIIEPLNIVVMLGLLFVIQWKLTLISLLVAPVTGFFIYKISQSLRRRANRTQVQLGEVTSRMTETFSGIRIVKAFNAEPVESHRFHKETFKLLKLMFRQIRLQGTNLPITEMLGVTMAVLLLWYGGVQVLKYQVITSEDFLRFIVLLFAMFQPIRNLANVNVPIQTGIAAGERIFSILDTPSDIRDLPNARELPPFEREIVYDNVSFQYPGSQIPAVKAINLTIEKGEVLALVGASGAGKSTLADLLPRFYDVTAGRILIDENDVREVTRYSLRQQLGIVSQETILFNDTIHNNIAYAMEKSREEVVEAAKLAHAHQFIEEMDLGYDTIIGERGTRLSGGQRQRIAIARALLKNPSILILDEATSALDTESERLVQQAIDRLMKNRTAIVIAHRLTTILNANRIAVMEKGRIVEIGNHEELLKNGRLYKKLYQMQFES
ncbi:MAG: ABC transporter ATP-binding protein/permease [Lentisphaeria bacterium]|nr:ABC transporter ATP-binding protein/permease [Candidatus Neomarinimicrobiota bacterium]MCF7841259.1 ABC transporter ATP-binding protein/permease [Lentisphaeria bacterium]